MHRCHCHAAHICSVVSTSYTIPVPWYDPRRIGMFPVYLGARNWRKPECPKLYHFWGEFINLYIRYFFRFSLSFYTAQESPGRDQLKTYRDFDFCVYLSQNQKTTSIFCCLLHFLFHRAPLMRSNKTRVWGSIIDGTALTCGKSRFLGRSTVRTGLDMT